MSLRVVMRPKAEEDLFEMAEWWAKNRSLEQADRWLTALVSQIRGLADRHADQPISPESREFPFEVRELRFGLGNRTTHRVLFTVRPDCVYVLLVRHVAQRAITLDDV